MKKLNEPRKVKLNVEKIKALSTADLAQAAGAAPPVSAHIKCVG